MQCLTDGRRGRYYCKPVDESAADRSSYSPDLSCAYRYSLRLSAIMEQLSWHLPQSTEYE